MVILDQTFVILAAGFGSRMNSLTISIPKPLIKFGDRPLIDYILYNITNNFPDVTRILIVTGYKKELLSDYISQLEEVFSCELICLEAPNYKQGNGHSLLTVESSITEHFYLTMCDHLFDEIIYQKMKTEAKKKVDLSLCTDRAPDPTIQVDDATKVLLDQEDHITQIGKSLLNWNAFDTGFFFLSPLIFERLNQVSKKYLTLTDGVTEMIRCGDCVKGIDVSGIAWADIDTYSDLQHAEIRLLDHVGLTLPIFPDIHPNISFDYSESLKSSHLGDD